MPTWNAKNPAIRRIFADIQELEAQPSDQYAAKPMEDNMFDWHFTIRGPKGTDFEGGIYHGRITLPPDYPFKPPAIMLLTPNGRWQVKEKICLSISSYHPEHWQPAWGVRTILEALISFMTTPADGAIGALEYSSETRRQLAIESQSYEHSLMPELPPLRDEAEVLDETSLALKTKYAEQISQLHEHKLEESTTDESGPAVAATTGAGAGEANVTPSEGSSANQTASPSIPSNTSSSPNPITPTVGPSVAAATTTDVPPNGTNTSVDSNSVRQRPTTTTTSQPLRTDNQTSATTTSTSQQSNPASGDWIDSLLSYVSVALFFAILSVLYRKALNTYGATGS